MKFIIIILIVLLATNAVGQSYIVNSTEDTSDSNIGDGICDDGAGNCTLRAAIEEVNDDGITNNIITFNISGVPPFIISPTTEYPEILDNGVEINGVNLGDIEINGLSNIPIGLWSEGINFELYNLKVINFFNAQIILTGDNAIVGALGAGNEFYGNTNTEVGTGADNLLIQYNIFGGDGAVGGANLNGGVTVNGDNISILNNTFSDCGNAIAVYWPSSQSTLSIRDNQFTDNSGYGIALSTIDNVTIEDNIFSNSGSGVQFLHGVTNSLVQTNDFTNLTNGVYFANFSNGIDQDNTIGPGNNFISNSYGILLHDDERNFFTENSFQLNTIAGIFLEGGNNDKVEPTITSSTPLSISGSSEESDLIQIYRNNSGVICQGETYLGSTTADALGSWTYSGSFNIGMEVTATATDLLNNTSEFSVCATITEATCTHPDKPALIALYESTNGDNWATTWDTTTCDVCTWFGVTCDVNRVNDLQLPSNALTGTLPAQLSELSEVTFIDLTNNALTGSLPPEWSALDNLNILALYENSLDGDLPSAWSGMASIQYFELDNNNFTGSLPNSWSTISTLIGVDLYQNNLSGELPPSWGNLTLLEELYLDDNNFSGCYPDEWMTFSNLDFSTNYGAEGHNLSNNPLLPWEGNIQDFFDGMTQEEATCNDGDATTSPDEILADCSCGQACPTGTTVTVTNTNDDGDGSLREAIDCANTDGTLDIIEFNIAGGSPYTIALLSPLPELTDDGIIFDNQASGSGTLILDGTAAGGSGLVLNACNGCQINSVQIENFSGAGIQVNNSPNVNIANCIIGNQSNGAAIEATTGSDNITIQNNWIGTDINGTANMPNFIAISLTGISNVTTGNGFPNGQNTIANNQGGLVLTNINTATLTSLTISNNNDFGIFLDNCQNITIGENILPFDGNTITGNAASGIAISQSTDCTILNNVVGDTGLGNGITFGQSGIWVSNSSDIVIQENTIAENGTSGIELVNGASAITMTQNTIYCNPSSGILLSAGTNQNISMPTISSATTNDISGAGAGAFSTVEVFLHTNSDCVAAPCQGRTFLGITTSDASGNWTLNSVDFQVSISVGNEVTATATDISSNTSEFSSCAIVTSPCLNYTADLSGSTTVCPNDPANLMVTFSDGVLPYDFMLSDGSNFTADSNPYSFTVNPVSTTTYSIISATDGLNCVAIPGTSATITIDDITPPTPNCTNTTPTVILSGATPTASISIFDIDNGSTDNCDNSPDLSFSSFAIETEMTFTCNESGLNTVTLYVTDDNNNQANCDAFVNVLENAPTANCLPNLTVTLNNMGNAFITPAEIDNGSTDDCDSNLDFSLSQTDFTCADVGMVIVTLTVIDDAENEDNCDTQITIEGDVISTPGNINGNQSVSDSAIETYSISPVSGANSYNWTIPAGATIISGDGTEIIEIDFFGASSGDICVTALNSCGESAPSCLSVTVASPCLNYTADLSGSTDSVCPNDPASLVITFDGGTLPYNFMLSDGSNSTATTNPYILTVNPVSTTTYSIISATDGLNCAAAPGNTLTITVDDTVDVPGNINGNESVCDSNVEIYSILPVMGADGYNWTVPAGATITSGEGTENIEIDFFGASSGDICVTAFNNCGESTPSCLEVMVASSMDISVIGIQIMDVCQNEEDATVSFSNISPDGTYDITYNLSNANTISATTTSIDVFNGIASLTIPLADLPNEGTTNFNLTEMILEGSSCTSFDTNTQSFEVYPQPQVNIFGNVNIELNTTEIYNGTPSGGTPPYSTHEWVATNNPTFISIDNNNDGTADIMALQEGDVTIQYTVTDANGCSNTDEFSFTIVESVSLCPCTNNCTTITVTNTNDNGSGSLRQAIECANNDPNLDNIEFNISGAGPHTIQPIDQLTVIADDGISISATLSGNHVLGDIILDGALSDATSNYGLHIQANGFSLEGLVIQNFPLGGIYANGNTGNNDNITIENNVISSNDSGGIITINTNNTIIRNNKIGTDITGEIANGNDNTGINISGDNNIIGGANANDGNIVSGNVIGILLSNGSSNNLTIENNFIGTNSNGTVAIPNLWGINSSLNSGINNTVENNVISGNQQYGIVMNGNSYTFSIVSNKIGVDSSGDNPLSNGEIGIWLNNAVNCNIGDGTDLGSNFIAFNEIGINLSNSSTTIISQNSIFCNSSSGIVFTNSNDNILSPQITTTLTNQISGTANSNNTIELFFHDETGCNGTPCQGKNYLGNTVADTDGNWTFNPTGLSAGDEITATATDEDNNTSEFSICATVVSPCDDFDVLLSTNTPQICEGENVTITIGINGGNAPFDLTISEADGSNPQIFTDISDGFMFMVSPTVITTYVIQTANDAINCDATSTNELSIQVDNQLIVSNLQENCSPNNQSYTVTFELSGGTPPYFIDGTMIAGSSFTSNDLMNNDIYDFQVTDSGVCPMVDIAGQVDCTVIDPCANVDAETISLFSGSTDSTVIVGDGFIDEVFFTTIANTTGQNFTYIYIVTDNAGIVLSILAGNSADFENAGIGNCRIWGLAYTGNLTVNLNDNINNVDLSDDCFDLSNFINIEKITSDPCSINCPSSLEIDFSNNTITPESIASNLMISCPSGDFNLEFFDSNNQSIAGPASILNTTCDWVGQTLTISLTDNNSGENCTIPLTITDNALPTIECPFTDTTIIVDANTFEIAVNNINPIIIGNCSSMFSYTLMGNTSGIGTGSASGQLFDLGTTLVTYTVTDDVGNSDECVIDVSVENLPPLEISPSCGTYAECDTITVDFNVTDFNDLNKVIFGVEWDDTILEFIDITNFEPNLNLTTDDFNLLNVTNGELVVDWETADGSGVSVGNGNSILSIEFKVVGQNGESSPIDIVPPRNAFHEMVGVIGMNSTLCDVIIGDPLPQSDTFNLSLNDSTVGFGEQFCLEMTTTGFENINLLAFNLDVDFNALADYSVIPGAIAPTVSDNADGLEITWFEVLGVDFPNNTVLFELCFMANGNPCSSTEVSFTDNNVVVNANPSNNFTLELQNGIVNIEDDVMIVSEFMNTTCGFDNGSINLIVNGGSGNPVFLWNNGLTNTATQTDLPMGNYMVTIQDGDCIEELNFEIAPSVNSLSINLGEDIDFCENAASVTLDATVPNCSGCSYSWSDDPNINQSVRSYTPTEDIEIIVTATDNTECSASDTIFIDFLELALQPNFTGNEVVCTNSLETYTITSPNSDVDYNWTFPPNALVVDSSNNSVQLDLAAAQDGEICLTSQNECGESPAFCLPISLETSPESPVFENIGLSTCEGETITYCIQSVPNATTYEWTLPIGTVNTTDTCQIIFWEESTNFTLKVAATNNCGNSTSSQFTIGVTDRPIATLFENDLTVCDGTSFNLKIEFIGAPPYSLEYSNGIQTNSLTDILENSIQIPIAATSTGIYQITSFSNSQCSGEFSGMVSITVENALEYNEFAQICDGNLYEFGDSFLDESGIYQDTFFSQSGCDSIVILNLQVDTLITFSLLPDDTILLDIVDKIELNVLNNDNLPSEAWILSLPKATSDAGELSIILDETIEYNIIDENFIGTDSFLYKICQTSCPDNCDSTWVTIDFEEPCFREAVKNIPDGISLSSEFAENRTFNPLAEFEERGCPLNEGTIELIIVNRWGEVIYSAFPYKKGGWDGRQNGKFMSEATYYYVLRVLVGEQKEVKGSLHLLR